MVFWQWRCIFFNVHFAFVYNEVIIYQGTFSHLKTGMVHFP